MAFLLPWLGFWFSLSVPLSVSLPQAFPDSHSQLTPMPALGHIFAELGNSLSSLSPTGLPSGVLFCLSFPQCAETFAF